MASSGGLEPFTPRGSPRPITYSEIMNAPWHLLSTSQQSFRSKLSGAIEEDTCPPDQQDINGTITLLDVTEDGAKESLRIDLSQESPYPGPIKKSAAARVYDCIRPADVPIQLLVHTYGNPLNHDPQTKTTGSCQPSHTFQHVLWDQLGNVLNLEYNLIAPHLHAENETDMPHHKLRSQESVLHMQLPQGEIWTAQLCKSSTHQDYVLGELMTVH